MENGLVFDVRTDTSDNGGGKVREYRCPARHRIVPYTSIRKSLSSAGKRSGLGHVRPHDLRHTFVYSPTGPQRPYRAGQLPRRPQVDGDDEAL